MIKAMSAPYGNVRFVPTGGITEKNLPEYLAFPKIAACGGSWMVPEDAIEAKDWDKIEKLAREAVQVMLGFEVVHIGINNENAETAVAEGKKLAALLGWNVQKDTEKGLFVGKQFEMLKSQVRGTHGHIAVATSNVDRARWHMEQRGFTFDDATATFTPDGRMKFIYLNEEFGGFAIHLLLK